MIDELKEIAMRGTVIDNATGIVIGGAIGSIGASLVSGILIAPKHICNFPANPASLSFAIET